MRLVSEDEALAAFIRDAGKMLEAARHARTVGQVGNAMCAAMTGLVWWASDGRGAALFAVFYLTTTSIPYLAAWAWRRYRERG